VLAAAEEPRAHDAPGMVPSVELRRHPGMVPGIEQPQQGRAGEIASAKISAKITVGAGIAIARV